MLSTCLKKKGFRQWFTSLTGSRPLATSSGVAR
jgi:hypothetical protein